MNILEAMFDYLDKKNITDEPKEEVIRNQIATDSHDGATQTYGDTFASEHTAVDFDFRPDSTVALLDSYRETAEYAEVDSAVQDVINEMVSFAEHEAPVTVNLDETELSDKLKKKIFDSWDKISNILELSDTIHQRARRFYIDGRLSYHKVVDKNSMKKGLLNIIELDPKYVTKRRNIEYDPETQTIKEIKEWYVYNENITTNKDKDHQDDQKQYQVNYGQSGQMFKKALKLDPASITYVTSGMVDRKTGEAIGWLDKAVRPTNQIRMLENALLIYRIVRAPERRAFYVDVGNMPTSRAKQYVQDLKNNYRNKMSYDPNTGTFKDKRHLMSMQEDYWLPRQNGRGTEISTVGGNSDLGQINDIDYFLKRLYKALNIPQSRMESDAMVAIGGRAAEISRDELKFSKFVTSVRKRFAIMFRDLLKTDLILQNVFTIDEWREIENKVEFKFAQDMYLEERKWFEMTRDRLELAKDLEQYIGKYYSNDFVRKEILKQSEEEIEEQDKLIEEEKDNDQFKDEEDLENEEAVDGSEGSQVPIGQPIPGTEKNPPADGGEEETQLGTIKLAISGK